MNVTYLRALRGTLNNQLFTDQRNKVIPPKDWGNWSREVVAGASKYLNAEELSEISEENSLNQKRTQQQKKHMNN